MKVDVENTIKQCTTYPEYQQTQPPERALSYEVPCKPWEVHSLDIFLVNNKMLLCIIDCYNKLPIMKKGSTLAADEVVQMAKMIIAKYGLPKNIFSDAGTNFTSETFRNICKLMNIWQSIISSYHHQSNGQLEAFIKLVKLTIKNALTLTEM